MTTKETILKWIDDLVVYELDYDILTQLINTNDRFLITALTELSNGNLILDDFQTLIGGESFDKVVKDKFVMEQKLEEDMKLILTANEFASDGDKLNKTIYENLLMDNDDVKLIEEVTDEEIYSFFKNTPESNLLYRIHKNKLLEYYYAGKIDKNFLNKYMGTPIIPINFNTMDLNEEDKKFALDNGLSQDEVKKMKSIRYYYRSRGE